MDKKQYDAIVDLLNNAERDDLVSALEGSTGYHTAKHVEELKAALEQLRKNREGAATWEADHQRRHLEALGLADEFPRGCDAIGDVGAALLGSRALRADLEAKLATAQADAVRGFVAYVFDVLHAEYIRSRSDWNSNADVYIKHLTTRKEWS